MRKSEAVHQRHAAQIYAEMLGQVCHKGLYEPNINGFQEVSSHCDVCSLQSFMIHARHATFYIFYAKFPNTYLRDIAMYGEEYKTRVPSPHKVTIEKSEPFRMRFPEHQARFFKLLSTVLYYLVSGYSNAGYLAADKWNPYYKAIYKLDVCEFLVCANSQIPRIYECVMVEPYRADPKILNAEGDLDGEQDAPDAEIEELPLLRMAHSVTSSTRAEAGSREWSPMDES